jgi:hypothetical protein
MDKKKEVNDIEPGPDSSRSVDRFGFIKTEQSNSQEGVLKSRSTHERGRYSRGSLVILIALICLTSYVGGSKSSLSITLSISMNMLL